MTAYSQTRMNAQAQTMFDSLQQPRKMIAGVCVELAGRSGLPVWAIRIAALILLLTHFVVALVVYFIGAGLLNRSAATQWRDRRQDPQNPWTAPDAENTRPWDRDGLVDRFDRLNRRLSRMEREAMESESRLRRQFRDLH